MFRLRKTRATQSEDCRTAKQRMLLGNKRYCFYLWQGFGRRGGGIGESILVVHGLARGFARGFGGPNIMEVILN